MSRKRWIKKFLAGLLAFGNITGCKQQIFMEPQDYQAAVVSGLPRGLETNAQDVITPDKVMSVQSPANVNDPDRKPRMITLKECLAIALEQGNVGFQTPTALGQKLEILPSFNGTSVTGTDSIRAFAIDPATMSAELERSLSKFDAQWINSLTWQKVDNPAPAQFLTFSSQYDSATLSSTLVKPLPTGGIAAITFDTNYTKYQQPSTNIGNFVNPNYVPQVQFTFEQPLLRLFGVEANELAPSHPGSQLLNIQPSGGINTQGILLQRIHLDQQKADFDIRVNYMLANVEVAYWNLYASYYNLYANEEGLREAFLGYRFTKTRVEIGTDPAQNADQAKAQYERFRRNVIDSRGSVLEAERQLRGLLGLRSDDGTRLVPIDEPNLAPYIPNFEEAANEAMAYRPEILQCRQDLKVQQLNLILQKNLRRPDLRFVGQYSIQGLGTRLDGSNFTDTNNTLPGNALGQLAADQYHSWLLGLRLTMPIGFRDANAFVREAQLSLARSYYQLRDTELKVLEYLVQQYRQVIQTHADIQPARAERQALQVYINRIDTLIQIGKWNPQDFLNYLTVQQQLATAVATEYQAIANYNNALATFEFAKGTIKQYNNVTVGEGPLPPWAQKKAADHIRERTEAIKLRERPDTLMGQTTPGGVGSMPVGPAVGTGFTQELPPTPPALSDKPWEPVPPPLNDTPSGPGGPIKPMMQPTPPPAMTSPSRNIVDQWPLSPGPMPGMPTAHSATPPMPAYTPPGAPPVQPPPPAMPAPAQAQPPAMPAYTPPGAAPAQPLGTPAAIRPTAQPNAAVAPTSAPATPHEETFHPAGTIALPGRGTSGASIPPAAAAPAPPAPPAITEDIFRPAGAMPSRNPGGSGGYIPPTASHSPAASPQLSAGTGMSPVSIPVVPAPTASQAAPSAVEFGPAGSVTPISR
jgi:outer membrane protein TolC